MATQVPPQVLPADATTPSISAQINAATRKQHAELNRLIMERLPLALPPCASNPALLGQGLAAFAQIYFAFEEAWTDVEKTQRSVGANGKDHDYEILGGLAMLRSVGLPRSSRLRVDLQHITGLADDDALAAGGDLPGEMLSVFRAKPHVLIAYAWVMYMAIFSGGRWIRQQLVDAGPEFWSGRLAAADKASGLQRPGFTFLSFDGNQDGEDIKSAFKAHLAGMETILTEAERQDVIVAAQNLFEHCIELVGTLDQKVIRQQRCRHLATAFFCVMAVVALCALYLSR